MSESILSWPALDPGGQPLPAALQYERGVWGKIHGSGADFRWIAATAGLAARRGGPLTDLDLGSEDLPARGALWRSTVGGLHYAVSFYPSPARDSSGRTSFLEKQVFEWRRPPQVPGAAGALLLLPAVAGAGAEVWWERRSAAVPWTGDETLIELGGADNPPLPMSTAALAAAAASGLEQLTAAVPEEALAELYALLLAGGRAVPLRGLAAALPPATLAALLLPLPRAMADVLSAAGWLPSSRLSDPAGAGLQRCWDLALGGATPLPTAHLPAPTADQTQQGRTMARAVRERDPGVLAAPAGQARAARPAAARDQEPVLLSMWGPPASGKTVLLAQLYIEADAERGDWEIFPTAGSLKFLDTMRTQMRTSNLFPSATGGTPDRIEYQFRHAKTGAVASLSLEDRSGQHFIQAELDDDVKRRLGTAAGLILLFDLSRNPASLETEIWRTLEHLHVASGRGVQKDDRPIAVCISKADVLIETPADFQRARRQPDDFVREHIPAILVHLLDRFCNNYRLFPVSAAGVRLRHGVVQPVVFYDEALTPRLCPGGQTFNLKAPFAWLLDQVTARS